MLSWWTLLFGIVLVMLFLDLGVFHRKSHEIGIREAIYWSIAWVLVAILFGVGIYYYLGHEQAILYFTGWLVEKSLSVDNLFVFIVIFNYFAVSGKYQHKVLFWGILGAIFFRAILIALGITLIQRFSWLTYLLGLFILITGIKSAFAGSERMEPEKNPVIGFLKSQLPVSTSYSGDRFFVRENGKLMVTPLMIVLLVIELTDIIFALDSIPAILAITTDPFLVYSSNLFAILGLRALYFALAGMMQIFVYLKYGVSIVLVIVGLKMLLNDFYHLPEIFILGAIFGVLGLSVLLSVRKLPGREEKIKEAANSQS